LYIFYETKQTATTFEGLQKREEYIEQFE